MYTTWRRASGTNGFVLAFHLVHIGRRSAKVRDIASELGMLDHFFDLMEDGTLTARCNELALMCRSILSFAS